jgi:hypothetical protein
MSRWRFKASEARCAQRFEASYFWALGSSIEARHILTTPPASLKRMLRSVTSLESMMSVGWSMVRRDSMIASPEEPYPPSRVSGNSTCTLLHGTRGGGSGSGGPLEVLRHLALDVI